MTDATDDTRTLEDALDGHRFAMVTTSAPDGLTSRPLTLLEQDGPVLRFFVSASSEWVQQLTEPMGSVQVSFADPSKDSYVALQGRTGLSEDRSLIERLWNPAAGAFFEGADDPDLRVLECTIYDGEWWDGPSTKVGQAIGLLKRALGAGEAGGQGEIDPGA